MLIAFDIDGTLEGRYKPNKEMHDLLHKFASHGIDIVVWSGGGVDYAKRYVERHKLPALASHKRTDLDVDLAIDDIPDTNLAIINLIIHNHDLP